MLNYESQKNYDIASNTIKYKRESIFLFINILTSLGIIILAINSKLRPIMCQFIKYREMFEINDQKN